MVLWVARAFETGSELIAERTVKDAVLWWANMHTEEENIPG